MSNQHPNLAVLQRLNAAFASEDVEAMASCFAPDAVWSVPGDNPQAGTYEGPDEILGFLAGLGEATGGTIDQEDIATFTSDWGVVELIRVTGERKGRQYDNVELIAYQIEDDRIVSVVHRPDQTEADRFFAD